jgi:hypothetical protein
LAIYRVHGRIKNDDEITGGGGSERKEKGEREGVRAEERKDCAEEQRWRSGGAGRWQRKAEGSKGCPLISPPS